MPKSLPRWKAYGKEGDFMTVGMVRKIFEGLDEDMEVYIEMLNAEEADGKQAPVTVIETYTDLNRVVLREDF